MCSQWGAISNPHTQVFYTSSTPKSDHWVMTEWKFLKTCFISLICENKNKVCDKNLWNWLCKWNLVIFDRMTSPQGYQFDPRMKILLPFCFTHYPLQFDMPHDHVQKGKFWPLGTPGTPKSHPWGIAKIPFNIFHACILFVRIQKKLV